MCETKTFWSVVIIIVTLFGSLISSAGQAATEETNSRSKQHAEIVEDILDGNVSAANSIIKERLLETPDDDVLFYLQATLKSLPFYPLYDQVAAFDILKKSAANDEATLSKYALLQLSYPADLEVFDITAISKEELVGLIEKLNSTQNLDNLANYQKDILTKANVFFHVNPNIVLKMYDFDNLLEEQHFNGFGYVSMPQILEYNAANSDLTNRAKKMTDLLTRESRNGFPGASYILGKIVLKKGGEYQNFGWFKVFSDAFIGNKYAIDYIDQNYAEYGDAALRKKYLSIYVETIIEQDQPSLKFCADIDGDLQEKCIVYSRVHDLECFDLQLSEAFNIPEFRASILYEDCRKHHLKKLDSK